LTYKDDSILARLTRLGFTETWRPDPHRDLGVVGAGAGIESIQEKLTCDGARDLLLSFKRPGVLIVRHVLEHAQDTRRALAWARAVVGPAGFVVFEVPDATRALDRLDYSTIWEEHVLYFTPATLESCLERAGFEVISLESYPYTLENSLVAIVRAGRPAESSPSSADEVDRGRRFIHQYSRTRDRIRESIRSAGRVAILGAGHLSGGFVNLYDLAEDIEFVVDDNPNKQGMFMPGSRLPIVPSSELIRGDIDLCLMSVRPEIEEEVVGRSEAFRLRGGVLASIFPDSPYSFLGRRPAGVAA
jgi:hypothetical protein